MSKADVTGKIENGKIGKSETVWNSLDLLMMVVCWCAMPCDAVIVVGALSKMVLNATNGIGCTIDVICVKAEVATE